MNIIHAEFKAMAIEMIAEYGKSALLRRQGAPTGPAYNPQRGPDVDHGCMLVETGYDIDDLRGGFIERGDKVGIISPDVDVVPAKSDVLVIDGLQYRFEHLEPLNPGGLDIIYEFVARR